MPLVDLLSPSALGLTVFLLVVGVQLHPSASFSAFWAQLRQFWGKGDTRAATYASIISGYTWSIFLAFPGDTVSRPTYKILHAIGPEWLWVMIFSGIASLQVWRLCVRVPGKTMKTELAIKMGALLTWTFVALACLLAQWPVAAAMADTVVVAVLTYWDFSRYEPCKICNHIGDCGTVRCPYGVD